MYGAVTCMLLRQPDQLAYLVCLPACEGQTSQTARNGPRANNGFWGLTAFWGCRTTKHMGVECEGVTSVARGRVCEWQKHYLPKVLPRKKAPHHSQHGK